MRRRSKLTALQSGISGVLGEDQFRRLNDIGRIRRNWAKVVGPMLAQHSEPLAIDRGCLQVAVDHPAMAQQFRFLHEEVRQACFRICKVSGISNIRTRHQPGAGMPPPTNTTRRLRRLSLSDKKTAAAALRTVHNKALRRAMFEARIKQLRNEPEPEA